MSRRQVTDDERWRLADEARRAQRGGRSGLSRWAREHGFAVSTARRWARVAQAFPPPQRQLPHLSFSHLEAVASVPERLELVRKASRERWTVARIAAAAATEPASQSSPSRGTVRSLGPQNLERASAYLTQLERTGGKGRSRMNPGVRDQVERIAALSGALAASWEDPQP
jgi:hypothetical protein